MHKILIKLVDDAILPAALLTFSKIAGVALAGAALNISAFHFLFLPSSVVITSLPQSDLISQNTFSDFVMYSVVFAGCVVILVKMIYFHQSHINPKVVLNLAQKNLLNIIQTTMDLYTLAFTWFIFLYLITFYILISAFVGDVSMQIGIILFIVSTLLGWILVRDIELEIENVTKKPKIKRASLL